MTELLFQTVINAVYAASYMSLIAVGLVLIFGVMGVINFAHGELYMVGAYTVVALYSFFGLPFFVAVAAGLVFVGAWGSSWNMPCSAPCATIRWAGSSPRSGSC
jgi:branched-chain amino acid transport system permease protein